MSGPLLTTLVILFVTTALFLWGRLRTDVVALLSLLAFVLSGVLTTPEALAGFSNSLVLMIAGLFVVGAGVFRTGLAELAGRRVAAWAGGRPTVLLAALMALVAFLSAFMSNTGTVAVLMPVIVAVALRMEISPSRFLMPVAFMSGLGGILTLIGTPPNLIASEALREAGEPALGFFSLLPVGLAAVLVGLVFMVLAAPRLLPGRAPATAAQGAAKPGELLRAYDLPSHGFSLSVLPESPAVGRSLADLHWPADYGVLVLVVEHAPRLGLPRRPERHAAQSGTLLAAGDRLHVLGDDASVHRLADEQRLSVAGRALSSRHLTDKALGVAEVLIPQGSRLIGQTLGELNWPAAWGLHVLALRRGERLLPVHAGQALRFADTLLVQGEWSGIEALSREARHAVVMGEPGDHAADARARGKAPVAAALMALMMLLMTFEVVDPVVAVWLAALGMVLTGCLRDMGEAYRRINWESVVLIGAMLPAATALQKTGGVDLLAGAFAGSLGAYGPLAVLAGFYFATMLLSQFISNTATAVLFAPVAIGTARSLGVEPEPLVVGVAVAASMAFATPIASPPNALVMAAGGYRFADYVRLGLPLQLLLFAVMLVVIPAVFPFR